MTKAQNIESIEKATDRTWPKWVEWLEGRGAEKLNHTEIARLVHAELEGKVESFGWWAQGLTVAYEQHIGRRVPGQRSDGTFEISVSRTVGGHKNQIFAELAAVLGGETIFDEAAIDRTRTSITPVRSYWRCDLSDGSKLTWSVEKKGDDKCLVVVTQANLLSSGSAETWRTFWNTYLDRYLKSD